MRLQTITPPGALFALMLLPFEPVSAHHSPGAYDLQATITIDGAVTKFEWSNPHTYISVRDVAGDVWLVEALAPTALRQFGWSATTLVGGDRVHLTAAPARDASRKTGYLTSLEKGGVVLFPPAGAPAPGRSPPSPTVTGLSGTWGTVPGPTVGRFLGNPASLPVTPKGAEAIRTFTDADNPGGDCVPFSAPLYMILVGVRRIEIRNDVVLLHGEDAGVERLVRMNVATHDGVEATVQGHSIGKWDGSTLVVDTARFVPHRLGIAAGLPSGSAKHLVERFELAPDGKSLVYRFTVEDPEYLTAPVSGDAQWLPRPDLVFAPMKCDLDNARRFRAR
jgi:hypothetical protein